MYFIEWPANALWAWEYLGGVPGAIAPKEIRPVKDAQKHKN